MLTSKKLFNKHFLKKYHKYSNEILTNIWIVDRRLKLAYLFDVFKVEKKTMKDFLENLKSEKCISNEIILFSLKGTLFLCNKEFSKEYLDNNMISNVNFIDISSKKARLLDLQKTSSHEDTFPTSSATSKNPTSMEKCIYVNSSVNQTIAYFITLLQLLSNSHVKCPTIHPPPSINITTLYGLFLTYPLVYWFSVCEGSGGKGEDAGNEEDKDEEDEDKEDEDEENEDKEDEDEEKNYENAAAKNENENENKKVKTFQHKKTLNNKNIGCDKNKEILTFNVDKVFKCGKVTSLVYSEEEEEEEEDDFDIGYDDDSQRQNFPEELTNFQVIINSEEKSFLVCSFSFPTILASLCDRVTNEWKENWKKNFEKIVKSLNFMKKTEHFDAELKDLSDNRKIFHNDDHKPTTTNEKTSNFSDSPLHPPLKDTKNEKNCFTPSIKHIHHPSLTIPPSLPPSTTLTLLDHHFSGVSCDFKISLFSGLTCNM